jgi:hypothetical protein
MKTQINTTQRKNESKKSIKEKEKNPMQIDSQL